MDDTAGQTTAAEADAKAAEGAAAAAAAQAEADAKAAAEAEAAAQAEAVAKAAAEEEAAAQAEADAKAAAEAKAAKPKAKGKKAAPADDFKPAMLAQLVAEIDARNHSGLRQPLIDELQAKHGADIEDEGGVQLVNLYGIDAMATEGMGVALDNWCQNARRSLLAMEG